jgi:hypothetical protein
MAILRGLLVVVAILPAVQQRGTVAGTGMTDGFISLFNGRDLTGWKVVGSPDAFHVEDGAIVAGGTPASHAFYDGVVHDHAFRDFELTVDVMTRKGSNGGIYVLTQYEADPANVRASGHFPSKGFEIQVNNSHTDRVRTGSIYHVQDVLDASPAKDDEWFTEDITVKGDTITVKVNGTQVAQWTQPADWNGGVEGPGRRITGAGTIALQAHDRNSTVYYKNIRIKPQD